MIFLGKKIIDFSERVFGDLNEKSIIYDKLKNSDYKNKNEIN